MRMIFVLALAFALSLHVAPQVAYADKDSSSDDTEPGGTDSGSGSSGGSSSGESSSGGSSSGGSSSGGGSSSNSSSDDDDDDDDEPKITKTSKDCTKGEIWHKKSKKCLAAEDAGLTDSLRIDALRELAFLGRTEEAMYILGTMDEPESSRVMTYEGFLLRQLGHVEESIVVYERAIAMDPANIAARSYYGQLLVLMNERDLAKVQLAAIYQHGGEGSWSQRSLASAIETGVTYNY